MSNEEESMPYEIIVVLDFGSQYNQLIVRRLRQIGVYAELWDANTSVEKLSQGHIKGIIMSGGPQSVLETGRMNVSDGFWNIACPILGICYGMQLMTQALGGSVLESKKGEYGATNLKLIQSSPHNNIQCNDPLIAGIAEDSIVWMSHMDKIERIPEGWEIIAQSDNCEVAIISNAEKKRWGIQFHPEVSHSEYGMQLLENFALSICQCSNNWNMTNYIEILIEEIQQQVGEKEVICGLSGGVDSAVAAAIIERALGREKLHCIYVDHGLMRLGESEEVHAVFAPLLGNQFHQIDAKDRFFAALEGVSNPEEKRKIIGREFVAVFDDVAADIASKITHKDATIDFLAQGTLYTDIVESGKGGKGHTIKSHHNVGGIPADMKFMLVEPLKKLFKDEVRSLGIALGLSDSIVYRQPFPGPGIGIRVLGEVTREKVMLVQQSDAILREEIALHSLDKTIWQYFTALPGIQSVGVQGDRRTYADAIIIRAICSVDGMTANIAEVPFGVLKKIAGRICNEMKGINRVLYDITDKPPGTIEFE